ncbi:unnamed protein product [Sphagnum troendelagicum]
MQVVGGGGVTSVFPLPPVAASFRQSSPPPTPPSPCSVPPRLLLRLLPPRPASASSSILHLRCNKKIPLRICCRGQQLPSPRRRTTRTRTTTTIGGPELPQTSSSSSSASSSGLQDLDNWKGDGEGERGFEGERDTSDGEELFQLYGVAPLVLVYSAIAEAGSGGYSQASYYTSLGLFLLSLPGVWSLVKRSTKSKVVKKTFLVQGSTMEQGKSPRQIAAEISSFFTRNNFLVTGRGDTITFEGMMMPSRGQAAFLTFCSLVSLACLGLVLSIAVPDIGEKWYLLTIFSPLAGVYYWTRASRKEQIQVKIIVADDESSTDVIVQGDDEQIDRLRRELSLMEKGMVYVKGLFEQ